MPPLRVGLFSEVYSPVVNGVVASLDALKAGLIARGHDVHCFAPRIPGVNDDDTSFTCLPSLPLPRRAPYRLTLPVIGRSDLDDIISGLDVIHAHSFFVTGWMAWRYARRYGIPFVLTYHTQLDAYAHYIPFEPHATRYAAGELTRLLANRADAVIAPTFAVRERLRGLGVKSRIEVIPSGVDVAQFSQGIRNDAWRASLGVGDGDRLFVTVARIAVEKNLDVLVDAVAQLADPSVHLAIVGDGPEREALQAHIERLALSHRVHLVGFIERVALPSIYASADAFVFASTSETQGIVFVEALAAGLPIVAANIGSNIEVLGENAVLVAAEPAAFAKAMKDVLANRYPDLSKRATVAALEFSLDRQADRTVAVYDSLQVPILA
ncbi:MAG: glycosyltransferase [Vulcanimicrobiaceae bacterium]